jgi:hypothetical protein
MSIAGETHTDSGTISVPYNAGSPVVGSIGLSAALSAGVGSASQTARPYVTISGDVNIADGTTVAQAVLTTAAVNVLSLIGLQDAVTITQGPLTFYPKGPGITLTLHFNGASMASAVFTGG